MKAMPLLWPLAGLLGWAGAFTLVYALHGIGCAGGWSEIAAGPTNLQRLVQVGVWLACLPPLAWLAWRLRRRRAAAGDRPAERWLAMLAESSAWIGLAATAYTLFPVLAASVCR